jgi:hypothetical protein
VKISPVNNNKNVGAATTAAHVVTTPPSKNSIKSLQMTLRDFLEYIVREA